MTESTTLKYTSYIFICSQDCVTSSLANPKIFSSAPKETSVYYQSHSIHTCCLVTRWYLTLLRPHRLYPSRLLYPWKKPGKNTGVGCHLFLQGIFPSQGLNLCLSCLLLWLVDSLPLSHQRSPYLTLSQLPVPHNH